MADGFIQLPSDSTGKILDTSDISFGVGSTSRHRERVVIGDVSSTTGLATVTSSAGLQTNLSSGTVTLSSQHTVTNVSASSGLIQLSSQITVTATGPVTVTSGLISVTSGIITATAATNPWSSAPGFNIPVVSVSSGLVQISGTPTVTATAATNPWSSAPAFNIPVVSVSSGLVQISGTPTVTATAATNPWSSAPGFNVPVVSVSSGLVQISGPIVTSTVTFSGVGLVTSSMAFVTATTAGLSVLFVTTSGGSMIATTSFGGMVQVTTGKIVPVLAASSGTISIDLWQGSSLMSPTFIAATTISKISSAPGNLFMVTGFTTSTGGIGATTPALLRLYNATTSNVTMNTGIQSILPLGMHSSSTSLVGQGDISTPLMLAAFGQVGMGFATACSFDIVQTATSTAGVAGTGYITGIYSTV